MRFSFTKKPWQSKTIQGLIVAALPVFLPMLGIHAPEQIETIAQAIGIAWAAYGRSVATGPLIKSNNRL